MKSIDRSVDLLLQQLRDLQGRCLIVADENWVGTHWAAVLSASQADIHLVSNRFDIARDAKAAGLSCSFNDFEFCNLAAHSFESVLFRVSKERASSHHIINQSAQLLSAKGQLLLSGEKNDGVKTYVKQACKRFGDRTNATKNGIHYFASIILHSPDQTSLDDKAYPQLRPIKAPSEKQYQSKPGIFGWDKIDRGSAFLIDHLPLFLRTWNRAPESLLDLGCGYGYLACEASQYNFTQITLTDNNAAAITAATANCDQLINTEHKIIAADAGDQVEGRFGTVLCNPPFHQGFSVDGDLTEKFLGNTKRLLAPSGRALFVVNTFIPLEHKAKKYFQDIEIVSNNGSFKLIALGH
jgi:16S rRNA (guanine1207-N2)-methyltransferase